VHAQAEGSTHVVLEDDLVDDARPWLPEADAVLGGAGREKVVHLLVDVNGALQILLAFRLRLDQMIAVNGGRDGDGRQAGGHELEERHLCGGVLACDAIRSQLEVGHATLDLGLVRVIQMAVNNLL
jgi:hypothetical protein